MSELNISQAVAELLKSYGSESVNTDNLDKTAHSKNITISEWNELVRRYGISAADVERVYTVLKNIIPVIDSSLAAKLDRIDEPGKLYGTGSNGEPLNRSVSASVLPSTVVQRTRYSEILVPEKPSSDFAATSKKYVDKTATDIGDTFTTFKEAVDAAIEKQNNTLTTVQDSLTEKLDIRTVPSRVYCTLSNGTQSMVGWGVTTNPKVLVQRTDTGDLRVPNIPSADDEATSKYFVTSLNDRLSKRVSNLENLNISYDIDDTTAKYKQVPTGVKTEQALLKAVYGAKGPGNNIADPYTFTTYNANESMGAPEMSVTYNDNGTITYTVGPYPGYFFNVQLPSPGKYYVYVNQPHWINEPNPLTTSYFMIDCGATFDESLGDYLETTRTLEVMVWKDPDYVTTEYEWEYAPEGTLFEPYGSYTPVKTLSISSYGSQIIPFPYRKDNLLYGPGYTQTINGLTYTVLEDGGIHVKGTATAYSMFLFCNSRKNLPLEPGYPYYLNKGIVITYDDTATGEIGIRWTNSVRYWEPSYAVRNVYIAYSAGAVKDEIVYPMLSIGYSSAPYAKYVGLIDTIEIPERVQALEGFGRDGSVLEFDISGKATLTVSKDVLDNTLEEPIVYDVSDDFLRGSFIKVVPGGTVRFKTDLDIPIPSDLWYATVKE